MDFDNPGTVGGGDYTLQKQMAMQQTNVGHPPTLQKRLDLAVKLAEEQLAEAKEARDIFARNPDLERLLNIMQKGRF